MKNDCRVNVQSFFRLSRRLKNNPCLIGEPGVGKTAVVEGLAEKISKGNVPDNLKNKLIITLDISSMVAGAKYRGDFEERIKKCLNEAKKFNDGFSILNKQIDENIFWTFSKYEKIKNSISILLPLQKTLLLRLLTSLIL